MTISVRLTLLFAIISFSGTILAQKSVASDEYAKTAGMQIYSNVFIHQETGDLLGYDLAIKRNVDSSVKALLYMYEGGNSGDGIPLKGQISNKRLAFRGPGLGNSLNIPQKRRS